MYHTYIPFSIVKYKIIFVFKKILYCQNKKRENIRFPKNQIFPSFFFTIFLFLDFFSDFQYLSPGLPELKVRLYQITVAVFYMPAVKISPWISEGFHKRHDRSPMGDHRRGAFIFPRAGCEHTLKPFQSPPAEFFSAFSPGKGQIPAAVHPLLILRVACKLSVVFILKITEVRLRELVNDAETFFPETGSPLFLCSGSWGLQIFRPVPGRKVPRGPSCPVRRDARLFFRYIFPSDSPPSSRDVSARF